MIHYQLRCGHDHEFDGWFKDSAAFDKQSRRGLVECPECGDRSVERALMAPAVSKRGKKAIAAPPVAEILPPEPAVPPVTAGGRMPAHVRALLQQVRREVERNCEYVGADFAAKAREIHRGESDARGIYGETSKDEAEALADEGIEVAVVPWVPLADS
jgi:hypothetical protein